MDQDPEIIRQGKVEYADFCKLCSIEQSPVLSILRAHLLIEYYMDQILSLSLPRGFRLVDEGNLTYYQKVALMDSLNRDNKYDALLQCMKNINKVRNQCAHEKDKEIGLADIELIGRPLGDIFVEKRREHRDNINHLLFATLAHICGSIAGIILAHEKAKINKRPNPNSASEGKENGVK